MNPMNPNSPLRAQADSRDPRRYDVERTKERGARRPIDVLFRIGVERVEQLDERSDPPVSREAERPFRADIDQQHSILPPRADRSERYPGW